MNATAEKTKFTPGPWLSQGFCYEGEERGTCFIVAENLGGLVGAALPWPTELDEGNFPRVEANARLIAAAPEMLAALRNVQKLISEAAMTGFNWKDGDWPERLFLSQQTTSMAIAKAEASL